MNFICQKCSALLKEWSSRCPKCGAWSSLAERGKGGNRGIANVNSSADPFKTLTTLDQVAATKTKRIETGCAELDRVLGGGFVPSSLVLIAGDPGIGKSTLILQTLADLSLNGLKALYASGEESMEQIKLRADRIGKSHAKMLLLSETSLNNILMVAEKEKPGIIVIDSIQTVYSETGTGAPSSISQLNECIMKLMIYAKKTRTIVLVVGHITKDGEIAGTKKLEHIVDSAIYFEGDKKGTHRILRAIKNRFGSTDEIGIFEMRSDGLKSAENASGIFIPHSGATLPGSVLSCTIEGTRPFLFEIQSLVGRSSYNMPQRLANGLDHKRLTIILALIERFCEVSLGMADIFVSVAGGLSIEDSGADLAIALAVLSSAFNMPMPEKTIVLGELGLSGEARAVSNYSQRIKEACRLGFEKAVAPLLNSADDEGQGVQKVSTLKEAALLFFGREKLAEFEKAREKER